MKNYKKVKKVKMKSSAMLKQMIKKKELVLIGGTDDGEYIRYGTQDPEVGPCNIRSIHYSNYDQEFLVVDHPNIITKAEYESFKMFFESPEEEL